MLKIKTFLNIKYKKNIHKYLLKWPCTLAKNCYKCSFLGFFLVVFVKYTSVRCLSMKTNIIITRAGHAPRFHVETFEQNVRRLASRQHICAGEPSAKVQNTKQASRNFQHTVISNYTYHLHKKFQLDS